MNFVVLRSRHFHHRIMNENEDETRFYVRKKWNIRTTFTPLSVTHSVITSSAFDVTCRYLTWGSTGDVCQGKLMYVARSEAQIEENITKRVRHSFVATTQPKGKPAASGWQGLLPASTCPVDEDNDRILKNTFVFTWVWTGCIKI